MFHVYITYLIRPNIKIIDDGFFTKNRNRLLASGVERRITPCDALNKLFVFQLHGLIHIFSPVPNCKMQTKQTPDSLNR